MPDRKGGAGEEIPLAGRKIFVVSEIDAAQSGRNAEGQLHLTGKLISCVYFVNSQSRFP